ncbi:uncharacterized protein LOC108905150 [Anoplophora glabripennis]|uniref:uncharacterized protein LOC108905150 n=1 Tax=Anoplophora glabripennis TaxID=217634 RepID=UPI0008743B6F|nr:uncharacterized protein LOC108905150 [Anoplophora glabripennis]
MRDDSVSYLTALATIQLKLLEEKIKTMANDCNDEEGNHLLYNQNYQNDVYQRLIMCIEHHIRLKKFRNTWVKHSRFAMLYIPVASLAPVGAGYFLIHQISPSSNFRMVLVLLIFATSVTGLCFIGQHFQDSFAQIFTVACNCPWIYWNEKNKKALLLLLINSVKPVEIASYTTIAVNLRLLTTFQKWIYSLITLMH